MNTTEATLVPQYRGDNPTSLRAISFFLINASVIVRAEKGDCGDKLNLNI